MGARTYRPGGKARAAGCWDRHRLRRAVCRPKGWGDAGGAALALRTAGRSVRFSNPYRRCNELDQGVVPVRRPASPWPDLRAASRGRLCVDGSTRNARCRAGRSTAWRAASSSRRGRPACSTRWRHPTPSMPGRRQDSQRRASAFGGAGRAERCPLAQASSQIRPDAGTRVELITPAT